MSLRRRVLFGVPVAVGIAALLAGLLVARDNVDGRGAAMPVESMPAPALSGELLVPPPISLQAMRGRPVVVNFWASWCEPCRREAPELARFARERPGGARLVGVAYQDDRDNAVAFVREFGWTFSNLFDPSGGLGAAYGLVGLPTTVVIDAEGRIAARLLGPQTFEQLWEATVETETTR